MKLLAVTLLNVILLAFLCKGQCPTDISLSADSPFNQSGVGPFGIMSFSGDFLVTTVIDPQSGPFTSYVATADCNGVTNVAVGQQFGECISEGGNFIGPLELPSSSVVGITSFSALLISSYGNVTGGTVDGTCIQIENAGEFSGFAVVNETIYLVNAGSLGNGEVICTVEAPYTSGQCEIGRDLGGAWIGGSNATGGDLPGPFGIVQVPDRLYTLVTLMTNNGNSSSPLQKFDPQADTTADVAFDPTGLPGPPLPSSFPSSGSQFIGFQSIFYERETDYVYAFGGSGKIYRMCSEDDWATAFVNEVKQVSNPFGATILDPAVGSLTVVGYDAYLVRPMAEEIEVYSFSETFGCGNITDSSSGDGGGAATLSSFWF